MKKFIFTANVIALLLLVPAVLIGYLNSDKKETKVITGEVVKNSAFKNPDLFSLVKTY